MESALLEIEEMRTIMRRCIRIYLAALMMPMNSMAQFGELYHEKAIMFRFTTGLQIYGKSNILKHYANHLNKYKRLRLGHAQVEAINDNYVLVYCSGTFRLNRQDEPHNYVQRFVLSVHGEHPFDFKIRSDVLVILKPQLCTEIYIKQRQSEDPSSLAFVNQKKKKRRRRRRRNIHARQQRRVQAKG